jgi:hypothetical protein
VQHREIERKRSGSTDQILTDHQSKDREDSRLTVPSSLLARGYEVIE